MSELLGGDAAPETQVEAPESPAVEAPASDAVAPEAQAPKPDKPAADPVQKRIDQLTWKAHENERARNREVMERQRVEQEANELRRQLQELQSKATMPKLEQYNFDQNQYSDAVQQHFAKQREADTKAQQEYAQRQQQNAQADQLKSHVEARIVEAEAKFPDYREVVNNPSLPPLASTNPMLFTAIITHKEMPALTYFLGKNPSEAHRLSGMPPALAIMELGSIAAKLPANAPQASKAPAPPAQVGNNATVAKSYADMSQNEYEKARRKARGIIK